MWCFIEEITLSTSQVCEYDAWGSEYSELNKVVQNQWTGLVGFIKKQDMKMTSQVYKLY